MTTPVITLYPDILPAKGQANDAFDVNVNSFLNWLTLTNGPELQGLVIYTNDVASSVLATALAGTLPPLTGKAGNYLRANIAENGGEFRTTGQVRSDILVSGEISNRNKVINGNFAVNQRAVSGTVVLAAGVYGHDRFKGGASGCTYTFSTTANVTTLTISAGSLVQVVEGLNLQSGVHVLSFAGTSTGKINAGSFGASGVTGTLTGGANSTLEFSTGTLSKVQLEIGTVATSFEHCKYGEQLSLCQKYYYRITSNIAQQIICVSSNDNTSETRGAVIFPITMRAVPSIFEQTGISGNYTIRTNGVNQTVTAVPVSGQESPFSATLSFTAAGAIVSGNAAQMRFNVVSAYVAWSAEL
jgi:hypothetical protein